MNENVPIEALYQELLKENKKLHVKIGMLKSEIDMLESNIKKKDAAIKAFKEWQKKVSERKIQFWLQNYIPTLKDESDEVKKFRELIKVYNSEDGFHKEFRKFIADLRNHMIMTQEISDEKIEILLHLEKDARFLKKMDIFKKRINRIDELKKNVLEAFKEMVEDEPEVSSDNS